jgi:hypothetical protein
VIEDFPHRHAAHCESGTMATLLRTRGWDLSEPMVFGIGGGLFFIHIPFLKVGGLPLTAYRDAPRIILKNLAKRLGVPMRYERFRNTADGVRRLDELLDAGIPVGLQGNIYWLSYFPADMRFQYNGHNFVCYGRRDDHYLLSDPVFETVVTCSADDLARARFARGGPFPPKGLIYYPDALPRLPDLEQPVRMAVRDTCRRMLDVPIPLLGVRGIRYLARRMAKWPSRIGEKHARANLANIIRMQEEIGTGGAGFRFLYAAFLQEAAGILGKDSLQDLSGQLTAIGDRWREFAVLGAQVCRGRENIEPAYGKLAEIMNDCAAREQHLFTALRSMV